MLGGIKGLYVSDICESFGGRFGKSYSTVCWLEGCVAYREHSPWRPPYRQLLGNKQNRYLVQFQNLQRNEHNFNDDDIDTNHSSVQFLIY